MDRGRDHLHRQACPAPRKRSWARAVEADVLVVSIDRLLVALQTAAHTRQRPAFPPPPHGTDKALKPIR